MFSPLKNKNKWILPSPPPNLRPLFSPAVVNPHVSLFFPLSSDLHVYKMEGFLSPSGEISCPRLSLLHTRYKDEMRIGQTHFSSSLSSKKRNLIARCSVVAVITIWNQSVVSASLEAMVDGFSVKFAWSSNETVLLYLLCFIHRWLCALQWQFVRLQPARPWCTYSGGPISADHPTGKMHTYEQTLWICHDYVSASVTLYLVVSDALALYINRGQCCKPCLRQPRGIRQATSTVYSLCI